MIVCCQINDIDLIESKEVRERLREYVKLEGKLTFLDLGCSYPVQAIEYMRRGWWYYVHPIGFEDYPFPFPAEFFSIEDSGIPDGWRAKIIENDGMVTIKRISFPGWAFHDEFYSGLVNRTYDYLEIYKRFKQT